MSSGTSVIDRENTYEALTYDRYPVVFTHGDGYKLFDTDGKQYIDLYGGHCVSILGHTPERVSQAMHDQAGILFFYSNVAYSPVRADAAERLVKMSPDGFDRVFFCNSGTEANENAIKLAWKMTGKTRLVATTGGWHGRTLASLSITDDPKITDPVSFALVPCERVPFGDAAALEACLQTYGDVALWLEAPPGAQSLYTEINPSAYFIPPYVGPNGWLGLQLNKGVPWAAIVDRVREAYLKVAPAQLRQQTGTPVKIKEPVKDLTPEQIDPLLCAYSQKILKGVAKICAKLAEVTTARQFGNPVWKAGKKTFLCVHCYNSLSIQIWTGVEQQSFLTNDKRYRIPPYAGHNGWIDLDVSKQANWQEIENLVIASYRHFATRRMLNALMLNAFAGEARN